MPKQAAGAVNSRLVHHRFFLVEFQLCQQKAFIDCTKIEACALKWLSAQDADARTHA
jgi:hypothetical protein